ncbi:MAG: hypothetical protein C4532_02395, partial [Candidatus Abyssobacteria bacterium SURF_17]
SATSNMRTLMANRNIPTQARRVLGMNNSPFDLVYRIALVLFFLPQSECKNHPQDCERKELQVNKNLAIIQWEEVNRRKTYCKCYDRSNFFSELFT